LKIEFTPMAREKGLRLTFVPCSLAVQSDRRLLRRLLQNLVSNAIKYTPEGKVLVGCRPRGDQLRIEIYDTGLGIPASKTQMVFREFQRLDEGAKVARGLGLGLSIVERIAGVLDHPIDLKSTVGRGTRFFVTVPLSMNAVQVQPQRDTLPADRAQLAGSNILCIDNDTIILDGMETMLSGWGCRVLKGVDLESAFAAINATGIVPHALLVDYHLDETNGIDVINALREKYGPHVTAILITADRSASVRDAARDQGVQLLNKPIKPAALRALLAQSRVQRIAAAE